MFEPVLLLLLAAAAAAPAQHVHRVEPGDTLIGLRQRLLRSEIRWQQLQSLNQVRDPLRLRPGSELHWPQDWLRERPVRAELLFALGTVTLEREGGSRAVQAGESLQDGDSLHLSSQSSATLRFADGSRLVLRPGARLRIERLTRGDHAAQTRLELREGAADSQVPALPASVARDRRYELRTPVANLGVRGTEFRSQFEAGALHVEVLEGVVGASQGRKEQKVGAGQGLVGQGRQSSVETLLAAPQLRSEALIERLPLRWSWLGQGASYRLQLWDASGQQLWLDERSTASQWEGGGELPDGDYRLRVRGIAASGLEGRDAEASFTLRARPEPPFLQTPAAKAEQYLERTEFRWTRSAAAARYALQIADDADFKTLRLERRDLEDVKFAVELPEGAHHWRVASLRADGSAGPWSDAQELRRLPPPPAPPPARNERQGDELTLRWAASSLPGARYQVQVSQTADFKQPWLDREVDQPGLKLKPPGGGQHQLRMRTLTADGVPGPWGPTQSFDWPRSSWWWLLGIPALALIL